MTPAARTGRINKPAPSTLKVHRSDRAGWVAAWNVPGWPNGTFIATSQLGEIWRPTRRWAIATGRSHLRSAERRRDARSNVGRWRWEWVPACDDPRNES